MVPSEGYFLTHFFVFLGFSAFFLAFLRFFAIFCVFCVLQRFYVFFCVSGHFVVVFPPFFCVFAPPEGYFLVHFFFFSFKQCPGESQELLRHGHVEVQNQAAIFGKLAFDIQRWGS